MRNAAADFIEKINGLERSPFVSLMKFKPDYEGGYEYYFTNNPETITYESNDYLSMPFELGNYALENEGSLPQIQLSIPDPSYQIRDVLKRTGGLKKGELTWSIINVDETANGEALSLGVFKVASARTSHGVVTLTIGVEDLRRYDIPPKRATIKCQHVFASGEAGKCTFVAVAGDTSDTAIGCDKTLAGANGCIAHQKYMTTNGTGSASNLSKNFGGFVGVIRP